MDLGNDLMKVTEKGYELYVDLRTNEFFTSMPEVLTFGAIELLRLGNFYFTRTHRVYEVDAKGFNPLLAQNGCYLTLPDNGTAEGHVLLKRRVTDLLHAACVLAGERERIFWKVRDLADGSVVVMDELGAYFHVTADEHTGLAVKHPLGCAATVAQEVRVDAVLADLERQVSERMLEVRRLELEAEERKRQQRLAGLGEAEPFQMGRKWGLRSGRRIVVPPIYRQVRRPVGRHCAFEKFPNRWGVMALDGRVEIEPMYEEVCIEADGRVKLWVNRQKVQEVRLC